MLRLTRARAAISRILRRAAAAQRTAVRRATTSSGAPVSAPKAGGGAGTALKVVGGVVTVVFGGAVAAFYGAPDWTFKQVLSRVAPAVKANVDVDMSFADVKGSVSLFPPAVDMDFKGLRVQRPVLPGKLQSAFDITFDRFSVRATASGVRTSSPGPVVERVVVDGMRGSFVRHPDSPPLPPVTFRQFAVDNAALAVSTVGGDPKAAPVPVVLEAFRSAPTGLRLHELPLSMAQSTIKGQLSGRPFVLQPLGPTLSNGARGQWSIRALPLSVLAPLAPAGSPLEWIGSGVTDINLITTFEQPNPNGPYTLRIDNTFSIGDVTAGVPASAPPLVKAVAAPVVAYLNATAGGAGKFLHLPLTTALTQQQIEAASKGAKPALTELARYFVADLGQQIADKAKADVTAQAKELGAAAAKHGGQWLSSFLGGAAPAAASAPAPASAAASAAPAPAKPPVNSANSVD